MVGVGLGRMVNHRELPFARVIADELAHLLLKLSGERMIGGVAEPHFIALILEKGGLKVDGPENGTQLVAQRPVRRAHPTNTCRDAHNLHFSFRRRPARDVGRITTKGRARRRLGGRPTSRTSG
jgi:hypothetical protein